MGSFLSTRFETLVGGLQLKNFPLKAIRVKASLKTGLSFEVGFSVPATHW